MEKKIVCYDIDGTLTTEMLFIPLVTAEHEQGILSDDAYASILETLKAYKTGVIDYENAVQLLIESHVAGLTQQDASDVETHAMQFMKSHTDLFRPFGRKVIEALRSDYVQFAVTAEPQYVANSVADYLDLDGAYASEYEIADGKFTGNITSSLAHRSRKADLLLGYDIFAAFGDSEGDIDMLANAQHPVCISPNSGLAKEAGERGWKVYDGTDSQQIISELIA